MFIAAIQEDVLHPDRKVLIFMNSAESVNVLYRNLINYMKQSPCKSVRDLARKVYRLSGSLTREVLNTTDKHCIFNDFDIKMFISLNHY